VSPHLSTPLFSELELIRGNEGVSLVPTTFLPLRLLSLTSLLGILSSVVLLAVIVADGTIKTESPGSLWDPMETNTGPNWKKLPICFGLMMSGVSPPLPSLSREWEWELMYIFGERRVVLGSCGRTVSL